MLSGTVNRNAPLGVSGVRGCRHATEADKGAGSRGGRGRETHVTSPIAAVDLCYSWVP